MKEKISTLIPADLRTEFMRDPIGLANREPRLSWRFRGKAEGVTQAAWQVQCAATKRALANEENLLWDSGRVEGFEQLDRVYAGRKLQSRESVAWRVRVWDTKGRVSKWSETASFEMGLLEKGDFQAQWITHNTAAEDAVPMFRTYFELPKPARRARLYVSARGVCDMVLNKAYVTADTFAPGWSDYNRRIYVCAYDVTPLLKTGENLFGGLVGAGWYAGRLGWHNKRGIYGKQVALWAQLEIELADGSRVVVNSDGTWDAGDRGPCRAADFFDGVEYDVRLPLTGKIWHNAKVLDAPRAEVFVMRQAPLPRQQMVLRAREMRRVAPGTWVFDLGQNMAGLPKIALRNTKPGQKITLRFAEMLNADGTLYTANYRGAKSTDTMVCRGGEEDHFWPGFTFHGFRYIEMSGLTKEPEVGDVEALVIHNDMEKTGSFECSDPLINRLASNIEWGQRGNFLEVPTDCPQRDERMGWTGDAQVFARTAAWNFDVAAFFEKWMLDMADSQRPRGEIPHVVPDILAPAGCVLDVYGDCASAAYADAAVICPWTIWRCYDDLGIVRQSWDMMDKWMAFREAEVDAAGVSKIEGFGDWLAIDMRNGNPGDTPTPKRLISTAYHARCAELMEKMALALDRKKDAARYKAMRGRVKKAFQNAFVTRGERTTRSTRSECGVFLSVQNALNGQECPFSPDIVSRTQTAYLLALGFDLLPDDCVKPVAEKLVADIESRGWHLSTGFVGTPLLAPVLTKIGRPDVAYKLLFQETYPSWLCPILQGGATTMWERWDSYTKDKGFGDTGMNSFNHFANGSVGEWLYATVLGIDLDPEVNGYREFVVRPEFCERLTWAGGGIETRYGKISIAWKRGAKGKVSVTLKVPPSTRGKLVVKGKVCKTFECGTHRFTLAS